MINDILHFGGTKSLKSGVHYAYSTPRLEPDTFQVLNCYCIGQGRSRLYMRVNPHSAL